MAENRRSKLITAGVARSPNRAMLRAVGFGDGDFDKPIVGVANGHSTMNPCNAGIQPLVELALMPVAVIVARATGMMRLMILGAGLGVAANVLFATAGTATGLFAGQILMGAVWGIFATLGIIVAQRLIAVL